MFIAPGEPPVSAAKASSQVAIFLTQMSETNISAAGRDQPRPDQAHRAPFAMSFLVRMGSGDSVMSKTAHYFRKKAAAARGQQNERATHNSS
jgi:hypothetical protein